MDDQMIDQIHYRPKQWVWWDLTKTKNRPKWIPKFVKQQAGEIIDIDGQHVVIGITNEAHVTETYVVTLDQIRPRGRVE